MRLYRNYGYLSYRTLRLSDIPDVTALPFLSTVHYEYSHSIGLLYHFWFIMYHPTPSLSLPLFPILPVLHANTHILIYTVEFSVGIPASYVRTVNTISSTLLYTILLYSTLLDSALHFPLFKVCVRDSSNISSLMHRYFQPNLFQKEIQQVRLIGCDLHSYDLT